MEQNEIINALIKRRNDRYKKHLQLSLLVALLIPIVLFYLFPRFDETSDDTVVYVHTIEILNLPPPTKQLAKRPPPVRPEIPVPAEMDDILEEVEIRLIQTGTGTDSTMTISFLSGMPLGYKPRQLLEVVPRNIPEQIKGEIIIQLRIDTRGHVKDYRTVRNTTGSDEVLVNTIDAAKQSLWEAAEMNGRPVEYWIEKIYRFNL